MQFRIHHVAISVLDIQESIKFYEVFGFRTAVHYVEPNGNFEIVHMALGAAFLELWWYRASVAAPESASDLATDLPRIGTKHLALVVESVAEAERFVETHGIAIAVTRKDGNTEVAYFFVKDPSGNLLEILEDKRGRHH